MFVLFQWQREIRNVGCRLRVRRHDGAGCWSWLASPVTPNPSWNMTLLVASLQGFSFRSDLTWRNITLHPFHYCRKFPLIHSHTLTAVRRRFVSYFIDCEASSEESRNSLVN